MSLYNPIFSCFFPSSSINLYNQIISLLASLAATYSTSINESAKTFYSFEIQLSVVPPIVKTYIMVLLLLSLSPVIFESTYPCRTMFEPLKHKACIVVPPKYLRIHFTAIQCYLPRFFIYPLTTPTTCTIFGLVHTIAYIKFPTTKEYETLDM